MGEGNIEKNRSGTGLGLSICKKLVNAMKGEISVETEVGKGSIFTFFFKPDHIDIFEEEKCTSDEEG